VNVLFDVAEADWAQAGQHVCWIVDDSSTYISGAAALLTEGKRLGQKLVLFGPAGSVPLAELGPVAALTADPRAAFLGRGTFDPGALIAILRGQSALAREDGYDGLCVVADMDCLLPERPATEAIVAFELLLDRLVSDLDDTVVCAYRHSSFDTAAITGALSVHPVHSGRDEEPPFRLVYAGGQTWRLTGEVDLAAASTFAIVFAAIASLDEFVIDVSGLEFVDVAGMRMIGAAARSARGELRLRGASPALRRYWRLGGFAESAPTVRLIRA
jgi:anti-anti-sigma regulatory factor